MDLDSKIRSRIEAILINDARNRAEIRAADAEEPPSEADPFAEERNLYQRIISSYRSASNELNSLVEENIECLSGLCKVADSIKEKDNIQEINQQIVDCVLQDFGAEYCALVFCTPHQGGDEFQYFEGIREQKKFQYCHSQATLLGSAEFGQVIRKLVHEATECLTIPDVYREPSFHCVDFPSVVRSMVFLPFQVRGARVGALVLSHSLPRYFSPNRVRALRILSSTIAHVWLLAAGYNSTVPEAGWQPPAHPDNAAGSETVSVVLINFECEGPQRRLLTDGETIRNLQAHLACSLESKESILLYNTSELLLLLPGSHDDQIPGRLQNLRRSFDEWKAGHGPRVAGFHISFGYSTCESGEDLVHTLETASLMACMPLNETDQHPVVQDA